MKKKSLALGIALLVIPLLVEVIEGFKTESRGVGNFSICNSARRGGSMGSVGYNRSVCCYK